MKNMWYILTHWTKSPSYARETSYRKKMKLSPSRCHYLHGICV